MLRRWTEFPDKYVNAGVTVEAGRVPDILEERQILFIWIAQNLPYWGKDETPSHNCFYIDQETRDLYIWNRGVAAEARTGDWVVKGPFGEFRVVKDDTFKSVYVPAKGLL